jgi:hypothetical protein
VDADEGALAELGESVDRLLQTATITCKKFKSEPRLGGYQDPPRLLPGADGRRAPGCSNNNQIMPNVPFGRRSTATLHPRLRLLNAIAVQQA